MSDFKAEGKFITGTIIGIPLTITRLADLTLADAGKLNAGIEILDTPGLAKILALVESSVSLRVGYAVLKRRSLTAELFAAR